MDAKKDVVETFVNFLLCGPIWEIIGSLKDKYGTTEQAYRRLIDRVLNRDTQSLDHLTSEKGFGLQLAEKLIQKSFWIAFTIATLECMCADLQDQDGGITDAQYSKLRGLLLMAVHHDDDYYM
jgi:hypothetical protein